MPVFFTMKIIWKCQNKHWKMKLSEQKSLELQEADSLGRSLSKDHDCDRFVFAFK